KQQPKLALPLRRIFQLSDVSRLPETLERHFFALGYTPTSRGDMAWSFERGSMMTAPWDSNYRKLKTTVNVAAYQMEPDRWQLRCSLDVPAPLPWHNPDQPKLRPLSAEFDDLRNLLGAVEALPPGEPEFA